MKLQSPLLTLLLAMGLPSDRFLPEVRQGWFAIGHVLVPNGALPGAAINGVIYRAPGAIRSAVNEQDSAWAVVYDAVRVCVDDHDTPGVSPSPADCAVVRQNLAVKMYGDRVTQCSVSLAGGFTSSSPSGLEHPSIGLTKLPGYAVWTNQGNGDEARRIVADQLVPAGAPDTPECGQTIAAANGVVITIYVHGVVFPATMLSDAGMDRPSELKPSSEIRPSPYTELTRQM
jgi:hypothetical protein